MLIVISPNTITVSEPFSSLAHNGFDSVLSSVSVNSVQLLSAKKELINPLYAT